MYRQLPHIIHRPVIDLVLAQGIFPAEAQERFKNNFYSSLRELEKVFSAHDDPEIVTRIDSITIDLGQFDYEKLDDQFSERLCEVLFTALGDSFARQRSVTGKTSASNGSTHDQSIRKLFFGNPTEMEIGEISAFNIEEHSREAFLYFLAHGVLPWWIVDSDKQNIETIFEAVADEGTPAFIIELKTLLVRNSNALVRLLYQFSIEFIKKILVRLKQRATDPVLGMYEVFNKLIEQINSKGAESVLSVTDVQKMRLGILLCDDNSEAVEIIAGYLKTNLSSGNIVWENISRWLSEESSISPYKADKEKIQATVVSLLANKIDPPDMDEKESLKPFRLRENKEGEHHNTAAEEIKRDESIDEWVYVNHAGLVLLHPFLPTFFSTLGLLKDDEKFANEECVARAIHLLAFLSSGKTNLFETDLPFCKFLCGMPLIEPIAKEVVISSTEINECEELLKAVITHWQALKNTSADGLREAFLNRQGKLDLRENIPVLYVESKAHDILLEKLPWGISYVQLPWINKPITTIWN